MLQAKPCDTDTGGVPGDSWCFVQKDDPNCKPAGDNWCVVPHALMGNCVPNRFSLAENLAQNGTGGGTADGMEWHRQPVLGYLLG